MAWQRGGHALPTCQVLIRTPLVVPTSVAFSTSTSETWARDLFAPRLPMLRGGGNQCQQNVRKPFVLQCLISVACSDTGGVKFKLMLTIWTAEASNTNTNLIPWPGPQYMPDAHTNSEPDTMDMQSSPVGSSR